MDTPTIAVHADKERLTLVVEVGGRKYSYNSDIEDEDELDYLALRVSSLHRMGSVERYLAQEYRPVE